MELKTVLTLDTNYNVVLSVRRTHILYSNAGLLVAMVQRQYSVLQFVLLVLFVRKGNKYFGGLSSPGLHRSNTK